MKAIDRKILVGLGMGRKTISQIARSIRRNRTTVSYRLHILNRDKLVTQIKINSRKIYYIRNQSELKTDTSFKIFRGEHILIAYKYLIDVRRDTPIYSVQGFDAIKNIFSILPGDFLKIAHAKQRRRGTIIRGFANRKSLEILERAQKELVESHIGRTMGTKVLVGDVFLGPCEILCSRKHTLIHNTATRTVLLIQEKEIAHFLFEIMTLFYETAENIQTFSMNEFLKKILRK